MLKKRILISICSNGKKEEGYIDSYKPKDIEAKVNELALRLNMAKNDQYDIVISIGEKILMHRIDEAV